MNTNTQTNPLEKVPAAPQTLASSQQATPLPLLIGEDKIAVRWVTDILKYETYDAPNNGKKG